MNAAIILIVWTILLAAGVFLLLFSATWKAVRSRIRGADCPEYRSARLMIQFMRMCGILCLAAAIALLPGIRTKHLGFDAYMYTEENAVFQDRNRDSFDRDGVLYIRVGDDLQNRIQQKSRIGLPVLNVKDPYLAGHVSDRGLRLWNITPYETMYRVEITGSYDLMYGYTDGYYCEASDYDRLSEEIRNIP